MCEPGDWLGVLCRFGGLGWGCARGDGLSPPVVRCWPFQGGGFVVVLCCMFCLACIHIIFSSVSVAGWPPFGK